MPVNYNTYAGYCNKNSISVALLIKLFSSFTAVIELYKQQNNVNLALQSKRNMILFFIDKVK